MPELELKGRVFWLRGGAPAEVAAYLKACDVLVQPYPDGVTTRRGSFMAVLGLGVPMVSNLGRLSAEIWAGSGAVALASAPGPASFVEVVEALFVAPVLEKLWARKGGRGMKRPFRSSARWTCC